MCVFVISPLYFQGPVGSLLGGVMIEEIYVDLFKSHFLLYQSIEISRLLSACLSQSTDKRR